ncbi:MAG: DUF2974 domain-containing protein [Clostridiales bacterium]|nr:DUF2974 domain-containing protein [Clostridiales bacterium]MBR5358366.1 DUF2974 domain-containing protein [Clostridiales bacterium]
MSNFFDYLTWRGDLTFDQDPFNDIDALILSTLSYVDFSDVVPTLGGGRVKMRDAAEKFFELHPNAEIEQSKEFISYGPSLLKELGKCNRYKDAYLQNYVDDSDVGREIQFAAIEIDTSDGVSFFSFRGTDDKIVGWKEDFNLSYMTVPAETEAVNYLHKAMAGKRGKLRVGGHSKGGHLAIYAASVVHDKFIDRIINIYSFDGPGFGYNRDIMQTEQFKSIKPRIKKFIPQTSIVGRLLANAVVPVIVRSNEQGIMQHDPLSWQLEGKDFETCDSTDNISDAFDESMTIWLNSMSYDDRKVFVDELFSVFEASGCETLSAMTKVGVRGTRAMIVRMRQIRNDSGEKVRALVKMFFVNFNAMKGPGLLSKNEIK